jgi:microcystin-dependent protein
MDAFIGEIRLLSFAFPPKGWLPCSGQLLPIAQNQALYSLLGTQYGGDGRVTFALPDLRGRVTMGQGQNYVQGQIGGVENVGLTTANMPAHTHSLAAKVLIGDQPASQKPGGGYPSSGGNPTQFSKGTKNVTMAPAALVASIGSAGGSQPHENRQPVMALNYCIATTGYFPSRG